MGIRFLSALALRMHAASDGVVANRIFPQRRFRRRNIDNGANGPAAALGLLPPVARVCPCSRLNE
jgi:hypothetical protein